jgi:hypothetical protein
LQLVVHRRIGEDVGGEARGDQHDSDIHPRLSMLERLTTVIAGTFR